MMRRGIALAGCLAGMLLICAGTASAAPPQILSVAVIKESVSATAVTLEGSINPEGPSTTYSFEYLTLAAYEANREAERELFSGASLATGFAGFGTLPFPVKKEVRGLTPSMSYRFRLQARNSDGPAEKPSPVRPFATEEPTNVFVPLEHRGWEMVSPIEKGGGAVQPPGSIFGGGVFQAAAEGGSFTYSSADSFGEGAQGSPAASQYIATSTAGGWATANITTPLLAGSYGSEPDGVPYQQFSGDLGYGLLSNGERCRGVAGGECPVANPPLPGSGAPPGYRDYYRRIPSGGLESLLTAAELETRTSVPKSSNCGWSPPLPNLPTWSSLLVRHSRQTRPKSPRPGAVLNLSRTSTSGRAVPCR